MKRKTRRLRSNHTLLLNKDGRRVSDIIEHAMSTIRMEVPNADPSDLWHVVLSSATLALEHHTLDTMERRKAENRRKRTK